MLKEKSDAFKRDIEFYKVVGRKIKEARQTNINQFTGKCFLITQTKVAQTIQKYEKGHNRIPLSQLIRISSYLKKPLSYFGLESFREEQE